MGSSLDVSGETSTQLRDISAMNPPKANRNSTAGEVVLRYISEQVITIAQHDPLLRSGDVAHIHAARIALRRLRSTLATYRRLLRPELADHLRRELKWFAAELGAARDVQVIHARLREALDSEPEALVLGSVADTVDTELNRQRDAAGQRVGAALDSQRYGILLADLAALMISPPLSDAASKPARLIIPGLIHKAWKRMHTAVRRADALPAGSPERETALHDARKSAKRLRYAAEAAAPLDSKKLRRLAKASQDVQGTLGTFQDSSVARQTLLELQHSAQSRGHNTFTYGRLHGREEAIADAAAAEFFAVWPKFPKAPAKV
jgi:CHAD domain-containing protein